VALEKLYRVRCHGTLVYEGRNEVAAQMVYDHLNTGTHAGSVQMEASELNWWPVPQGEQSKGTT
jgi:hypothetical protein